MNTIPTPLEMLERWAQVTPDKDFLIQPVKGQYKRFSWLQVDEQARRLATALLGMGLCKGDRVAILSKNCAEWMIADFAIQAAGLVSVPLYASQSSESIRYVINHSEAKAVFIGPVDDPQKLDALNTNNFLRIGLPYEHDFLECYDWNELLTKNAPLAGSMPAHASSELMTIIYTSGTTGNPKGVMHTYGSVSFSGKFGVESLNVSSEDRFLSYLPLSHAAERAIIAIGATYAGAKVTFVESLETFRDNLEYAKPTVFFSVPRLWRKFEQEISKSISPQTLKILTSIPFINNVVKKRIRYKLGLQHARIIISGSAPIPKALLKWYASIGIEINEAYGTTENISYGPAINLPGAVRLGSVGSTKVYPQSETRITELGEVVLRSPTLMEGYYLEPEKTEDAIRSGWYHTGDLGEIDKDGYLFITGRVNDSFKTAKGKFVLPNKIEQLVQENAFIEQACVAGLGAPQPYALVELTSDAKLTSESDKGRLTIEESVFETLSSTNKRLEQHERVNHIFFIAGSWTIENGALTPTMKLKRNVMNKRYHQWCESHLESRSLCIWERQVPS